MEVDHFVKLHLYKFKILVPWSSHIATSREQVLGVNDPIKAYITEIVMHFSHQNAVFPVFCFTMHMCPWCLEQWPALGKSLINMLNE